MRAVGPVDVVIDSPVLEKYLLSERTGELDDLVLTDQAGHEEVRATLSAYERALDRCGRLLVAMARLNLEDRLVKMDEAMLVLLAETMLRVLGSPDLALSAGQVVTARTMLAAELRAAAE